MKLPGLKDDGITPAELEINHIQINKEIDAIQQVRDSQENITYALKNGTTLDVKQDSREADNNLEAGETVPVEVVTSSKETGGSESIDIRQPPKCSKTDKIPESELPLSAPLPDKLSSFAIRTTSKKAFFTASLRPTLPPITESDGVNLKNNPISLQQSIDGAAANTRYHQNLGGINLCLVTSSRASV